MLVVTGVTVSGQLRRLTPPADALLDGALQNSYPSHVAMALMVALLRSPSSQVVGKYAEPSNTTAYLSFGVPSAGPVAPGPDVFQHANTATRESLDSDSPPRPALSTVRLDGQPQKRGTATSRTMPPVSTFISSTASAVGVEVSVVVLPARNSTTFPAPSACWRGVADGVPSGVGARDGAVGSSGTHTSDLYGVLMDGSFIHGAVWNVAVAVLNR